MKALIVSVLLCSGLAFASCGGGEDSTSQSSEATKASTTTASSTPKPKVVVPTTIRPTKYAFRDVKQGTGPEAKAGDQLDIQYVGVGYKTGKEFDSSWGEEDPFSFTLGRGEVIKGWEQGMKGMKVGGLREMVIPPNLGYGSKGTSSVAPGETLVYSVELLAIK